MLKRYLGYLSAASVSPVSEFALRFARTIILSRLLMPEDLGAAIALITILYACEVIMDVGIDKFVMVNTGARAAQAVAAAQQIAFIRSVVIAIALVLFAPALADAFGASARTGSIRWLGVISLLYSLRNLRTVQLQQELRYGPEAFSNVVGRIGGLIAVVPAALWFRDEHAMLASLIVEAALSTGLSYLVVSRERVYSVDPAMRRAALSYGLPLMVNGIALVILNQLDRVIVANVFDLATLALYSLALGLAIVPTSPLQRVAGNIGMPVLSRASADPTASREAGLIFMLGLLFSAALYAVGVGVLLEKLVPLIYGARYQVSALFCLLAAAVTFLRITRGGVNIVLLAFSRTGRLTAGNLMAGFGLLCGFGLALWSHRVEAVVAGLLIGDLLSLIILLALAARYLPMTRLLAHGGALTAIAGVVASGPLTVLGSEWAMRALLLAAGSLAIGLDAAFVYRRVIAGFVAGARGATDPSKIAEFAGQTPLDNRGSAASDARAAR